MNTVLQRVAPYTTKYHCAVFHFARGSGRVDMFKWPRADGVAIASVVGLFNRKRNHRWTKKKWYKRRPQNTQHTHEQFM